MKINIVCSSGSPTGIIPEDVHGKGVGGAELALVTTAEQWAKAGHNVAVFNNPVAPGDHGGVQYCPVGDWSPKDCDVLILFRTPFRGVHEFKGKKIFWSCDQYTIGDYKSDIFPFVDKVVTISLFHTEYFKSRYDLDPDKIRTIDIGVRTWEYEHDVEKVPGRVVFCSVPNRGLKQLRLAWDRIYKAHPEISLTITSDFRLWGAPSAMNDEFKVDWRGLKNVYFYGKVSRSDLIKFQMQAQWMLYPCIYEELFCIAAAECQVAGAIPITSGLGALATTNCQGLIVPGDPKDPKWINDYADLVVASMNKYSEIDVDQVKRISRHIFGFQQVLEDWKEVLE